MKPGDIFPKKLSFYCLCQGTCRQCEDNATRIAKLDKIVKIAREILVHPFKQRWDMEERLEKAFAELDGGK